MGKAREAADRITDAILANDYQTLAGLYGTEAVLVDPVAGEVTGEGILQVLRGFTDAFPQMGYEQIAAYESGDTAIDEGYLVGTNTGPLALPSGETLAPTGRQVRVRSCDILTLKDGRVASHRFYYDQFELLSQLGLAPDPASV
ncbi:MAG: nuclear transport factor 2 family protein [Actinomycetota bacterium]